MFISVNQFEREMGVNKTIGRFFVDRKPPENNSFWKGRLLYISFGNGFVSIPVYYDILYRIGVPLEILLSETHIVFMERLMHYAIEQEKKEISKKEELDSIRDMLKGRIKNSDYYTALNQYLDQTVLRPMGSFGLPHPSLNRADVFLYVLCDLPLSDTQWESALKYWYALHPTYLIMDDVRDFTKDKEEGEENVAIDLGGGTEGFEKTLEMYRRNCEILEEINPVIAQFLTNCEEDLLTIIRQPSSVNRQQ
ncbi:MAG TPA: hypothetical protein VK772_17790 [Puia sp.]|nr:hypothetical protein [Puia sp.]